MMADELGIFTMGVWTVKEGKEEEFIESWKNFANWTNEHMAGAIGAYLTRERSNPHVFVTFGPWTSDDAILRWRRTEEFKAFFAEAKQLCTQIQPLTLDTVTSIGTPQILAGLD